MDPPTFILAAEAIGRPRWGLAVGGGVPCVLLTGLS